MKHNGRTEEEMQAWREQMADYLYERHKDAQMYDEPELCSCRECHKRRKEKQARLERES